MVAVLESIDDLISTFSLESVLCRFGDAIGDTENEIHTEYNSIENEIITQKSALDENMLSLEEARHDIDGLHDYTKQKYIYETMYSLQSLTNKLLKVHNHFLASFNTKIGQINVIRESFSKIQQNWVISHHATSLKLADTLKQKFPEYFVCDKNKNIQKISKIISEIRKNENKLSVLNELLNSIENWEESRVRLKWEDLMIAEVLKLWHELIKAKSLFIMNGKKYYDTKLFHQKYIIGKKIETEIRESEILHAVHPSSKCMKIFEIEVETAMDMEVVSKVCNVIDKELNDKTKIFIHDSVKMELFIDDLVKDHKANAYLVFPCYLPLLISGYMNQISHFEYMFPIEFVSMTFDFLTI